MKKVCEICGREHSFMYNIAMEGDEGNLICPTCYFLACPSYRQLERVDAADIQKSSHPALNMYLYQYLCNTYGIPTTGTNSSDTRRKEKQPRAKSNPNEALIPLNTLPPEPFYGREKDIQNIFNILSRKTKRNPLILGPAGTGKTAIVRQIARMINKGEAPSSLLGCEIIELNLPQMVAGTKYRGDLEEKVLKVLSGLEDKNNILFIDDIHTITASNGDLEDNGDIGHILRPYIVNKNIQIIGTSTTEEYRKTIEANKTLERLFMPVYLEEQSIPEVNKLMKSLAAEISKYHNVTITNEIVESCVSLADQYIKYRNFPDKAIDLLDMACSEKKNAASTSAANVNEVKAFMTSKQVKDRIDMIPKNIDPITIFSSSETVKKNLSDCSNFLQDAFERNVNLREEPAEVVLNVGDVAKVIESWTKIPVRNMTGSYKEQLKSLGPDIKARVVGQDEAVDAVVAAVCRRKLGISNVKRPASFIFVGETGVGKTELAKALTTCMFGSESKMIRFDMSEYMESHSVSKLIGSPPGYVGYNDSGQLTEALRRNPFSVILFDEIEKAHADVSNVLLQVLDDGRITDAKGSVIDASNAIIILTSNAGATLSKSMGFGKSDEAVDEETFKKGLTSAFRPEFLGRVDSIITFKTLTDDNYKEIARHYVDRIAENLNSSFIDMSYTEDFLSALCKKANTQKYHAREIARTVTKYVEDAIAAAILESDTDVEAIRMDVDGSGDIKVLLNDNAYSFSA